MELLVAGNTVVLSRPVTGSELAMAKDAFVANPKIELVVLRNSHGGETRGRATRWCRFCVKRG